MNEKLPEGWVSAKLGDVVFPRDTRHPNESTESDFLYVDIEALDNRLQKIVAPKKVPSSEAPGRARLVIHTNDVIFSLTRPYLKNIAIVPPELDNQIASTAYCVMRPERGVSSNFIFYLITRDEFINSIVTYGDSPPAAHDDEFLAMEIPLAPTNEQHRIVSAIEQQLTRLDNAVVSLQSAKARAKQYRASLLKAAVEGKLTKEWRAKHPIEETGTQLLTRILAERRARWEEEQLAKMHERGITPKDDKWKQAYKEPQGADIENLPELPERWCWATVEQVITFLRNGLPQKPEVLPPGYRILRINAVRPMDVDLDEVRYLSLPEDEVRDYIIDNGDILFTRYNGSLDLLGVAGVVKGCSEPTLHPDKLIRVKTVLREIFPLYIEIACNVGTSRAFIESRARTTAGQKGISGSDIKQVPIPLPPFAEQEQIVAEVEARLSNIAQMEVTIENNLKRAEHERQSILREGFVGQLVPQDPEDEPASNLLERIREERKKREEAEKIVRVSRKRIQMESTKKRQAGKANLHKTLVEAKRPLPPDDLFKRARLKVDEQPESVEVFYEELHVDENVLIREMRPDDAHVLLEALEPSAEVLTRTAEAAIQVQEAEQSQKTIDAPMLWNM